MTCKQLLDIQPSRESGSAALKENEIPLMYKPFVLAKGSTETGTE